MRRYAVAPDHGRPSYDEPEASIGMSRTTHSMHGKTVLITGGTGGIDRAAAIGLLLALIHRSAWKRCSRKFTVIEDEWARPKAAQYVFSLHL